MAKIVQASISENGDAGWNGNAKAGDQTGGEVHVRSWYDYPWDIALRYSDTKISSKAASIAVKLANSNLVGYDQTQRNTLYNELKKVNFDVDKYIKSGVKTETDCSAFVYACYACVLPKIRYDGNSPVTSTMWKLYKSWGFDVTTPTAGKLIDGDIVLNEINHTAIVYDGATVAPPKNTSEIEKAIETIACDVIAGNWGNGENRKNNIYNAIQRKVNELLK